MAGLSAGRHTVAVKTSLKIMNNTHVPTSNGRLFGRWNFLWCLVLGAWCLAHFSSSAGLIYHPATTNSIVVFTTTNNLAYLNGYPLQSHILPSNTWSFNWATNGMRDGDIRTVNSNGVAEVTLLRSNGVTHIIGRKP
jgi:hypothetical protein